MKRTRTSSRKQQHVNLVVSRDVSFQSKSAGFDRWEFLHDALPEIDLAECDTGQSFLGKRLALPFLVASMTGGYGEAVRINRELAELCARMGLGMGVGSQRQALEDARYHRSFTVVREVAPEIPLFGNLGAAEVAKLKDASPVQRLVDLIRADGFAVHLNPLQEFLQPEGNPGFAGVLRGVEMLVKNLRVPVLVKEIGAGISAAVARRLIEAGVRIIDVAGAGGTSWAGVEILRRKRGSASSEDIASAFWDWGIPTVDALRQVCSLKSRTASLMVIGSGGIRSGMDAAKAIAFGADLASAARPILAALVAGGVRRAERAVEEWALQLRGAMFLTGSKSIAELQRRQLMLKS